MALPYFLLIYLCVLAFAVYIWKGIGDINAAYDRSSREFMYAEERKRAKELEEAKDNHVDVI